MAAGVVLATAGYGSQINFWDVSTGTSTRSVNFPDSQVNVLAVSPDKLHLVAGGNPKIRMFETSTNNPNPVTEFEGHTSNVTAVGFPNHSRWVYSGSEDGTIKIFDTRSAAVQRNYENKDKVGITSVALHPNQAQLISADQNGTIRVWDLPADKCIAQSKPETDDIAMRSVSVASNGSMVAACNNVGHCFLWLMDDHQSCYSLGNQTPLAKKVHDTYSLKCLISPDRKLLATASADHTVKLWRLPDFTLDKILGEHQRWVHDIAFSADSSFLASASSDGRARLWQVSDGEMVHHYTGHTKAIVAVALNDSSLD
ncbi:Guanine nucleotide-binding protein subunit beta-2-like 1 [Hondaea fermentalgiana]|uniref:Target of rapamycin complex subunit LST8 n=1 Tax=Hondaea fermentalgiana TaxID=2315210 RepID=A0A2R5G937_9STRA|nr:Guanine nucleotide-binding protein subunit beta-2-like 1 [Hondaea fermentalgiana]|eukprot:GBG27576.1 Guanine nucleotide-binding protein subunit beta-2-like 1 [Hondaea fermentalgiana]